MALVIPVPEIQPRMLADRLIEIARKENLKVEYSDLMKLAERSGCDIRTCLGALQYMRGSNIRENLSLGLKDTHKGLFDSWKTLLQVPMNQKGFSSPKERIGLVLKTVNQGNFTPFHYFYFNLSLKFILLILSQFNLNFASNLILFKFYN